MKKLLVLSVLALTILLASSSEAVAGDFICTSAFAGGTYDNVVVPPGATCHLTGATVKGNVKALENSRLRMDGGSVGGDIDGDKAERVTVVGVTVGGSIQIKEGEAPNDDGLLDVGLCGNTISRGNIQVEKMRGSIAVGFSNAGGCDPNRVLRGSVKIEENETFAHPLFPGTGLEVQNNSIRQNLQVFKNSGPSNKTVSGNTVRQIIQCKENSAPFTGGPNTAPKKEDQCF